MFLYYTLIGICYWCGVFGIYTYKALCWWGRTISIHRTKVVKLFYALVSYKQYINRDYCAFIYTTNGIVACLTRKITCRCEELHVTWELWLIFTCAYIYPVSMLVHCWESSQSVVIFCLHNAQKGCLMRLADFYGKLLLGAEPSFPCNAHGISGYKLDFWWLLSWLFNI